MSKRLDAMRDWSEGFAANFNSKPIDGDAGTHWLAGYRSAHELRPQRREALNAHLHSFGMGEMDTFTVSKEMADAELKATCPHGFLVGCPTCTNRTPSQTNTE